MRLLPQKMCHSAAHMLPLVLLPSLGTSAGISRKLPSQKTRLKENDLNTSGSQWVLWNTEGNCVNE